MSTFAPSATQRFAMALPMPVTLPVMRMKREYGNPFRQK
jgi:hypothetical protein